MNDVNCNVRTNTTHMVPVLILTIKVLVLRQIRLVQVVWKRIGQLVGKLLKWRCAVGLRIVAVELHKRFPDTVIPQHSAHGGEIQVVTRRIAPMRATSPTLETVYPAYSLHK